jgi:flavin reductase (DIM6/NTAB) family NADH-FMN oxidoreductase RutF
MRDRCVFRQAPINLREGLCIVKPVSDLAAGHNGEARYQVPADDYRALMSSFPTGVAVVTAIGADALPRGATCSSLCSVTLTPPTLLVCLKSRSETLDAIRARAWFAVNLLHARARRTAETFASPVADRFAYLRWQAIGPAALPWLVEAAFAVSECRLAGLSAVGDHTIVFGQVTSVTITADAPLLYGMRRYGAWLPDDEVGSRP